MTNRQLFALVLLGIMVAFGYVVIKPFLVPISWATILALMTWPAYLRLHQLLGRKRYIAAITMTALLIVLFLVPLVWLLIQLQGELTQVYQTLSEKYTGQPILLPGIIARTPVLGPLIQEWLNEDWSNPLVWQKQLRELIEPWLSEIAGIAGKIGQNILKLTITVITLFFFYSDGEIIIEQIRRGLRKILGDPAETYFRVVGETTRAVVYGLIVSAMAQGFIAGMGYGLMDVGAPVLLGALTALTSLIPFIGTLMIWGPIGIWLLLTNHYASGLGILAWGSFLVNPADNILRPILISSASSIPLLLVLFGVLGGLLAFGMVGLFIGPLILSVLLAIWREWLVDETNKPKDVASS